RVLEGRGAARQGVRLVLVQRPAPRRPVGRGRRRELSLPRRIDPRPSRPDDAEGDDEDGRLRPRRRPQPQRRRRRPPRGDQVLSSGRPAIRLARQWRAPLSLGLGVPLLLGSSPAAAAGAGAGGVVLGGLTTWLGMFAALLALLAPRRPGDVAGAAAVVVVGALLFAIVVRRRQRERSQRAGAP